MPFLLTADDFGASREANHAILKAHAAGTIQAASLMMSEEAAPEAVELAKAAPSLQVGLHVVLVDGKSILPYSEIPDLIDFDRNFPRDPAYTWMKYFFNRKTHAQLVKEVEAQFEAFGRTGLPLSHVDGHHHQHLHPAVLKRIVELARNHGARWIRLTREDLRIWRKCTPQPSCSKKIHGLIYNALTWKKADSLRKQGFKVFFDGVFGFLDSLSISKEYLLKLLDLDPPGRHELYFHPGARWNHDLELLLDPQVRDALLEKRLDLNDINNTERF